MSGDGLSRVVPSCAWFDLWSECGTGSRTRGRVIKGWGAATVPLDSCMQAKEYFGGKRRSFHSLTCPLFFFDVC